MAFLSKNLRKSICYDDYWRFAYLRQEAFKSSVNNISQHSDEVLDLYKFTNCYRVLDRTTQYLIKNVIYSGDFDAADTFFRILLFKIFNKIETWERIEKVIGVLTINSFEFRRYSDALHAIKLGNKIYSAAYIMPSGKNEYGSTVKHENNLRMLELMLNKNFQEKVWKQASLKNVYDLFLGIPSIGRFLAYQYATDIGYSKFSSISEDQFVVAGPGALRGIKKCFPEAKVSDSTNIIEYMAEVQDEEFYRLGYDFKYLENRKLQLIDCQNLFCELDKYLRVKRPEYNLGNSRIKQKYRKNSNRIEYFFPPHWNVCLPMERL